MFGIRKSTPTPTPAPQPVIDVAETDPYVEAVTDEDLPATGVFLGSLRSEVDEVDDAPEPFARVATATEAVIGAYRRQYLTDVEAAERLRTLRLRADDDTEWTLGPTTLRWYRRFPGGRWKAAVPPVKQDATLATTATQAIAALTALGAPAALKSSHATASNASGDAVAAALEATADSGYGDDGAPMPAMPAVTAAGAPVTPISGRVVGYGDGYGEDASEVGYGEAEDASAPAMPTVSPITLSTPTPGAEATDAVDAADKAPQHPQASAAVTEPLAHPEAADAEADAELLAMLAALSQDTGIRLSGLDDPAQ